MDLRTVTNLEESGLFNDKLLDHFIRNFYGYGTYSAPYWFVGMEEGGTEDDIHQRLVSWNELGQLELVELNPCPANLKFLTGPVRLQRTWSKLIRLFLNAENRPVNNEAIRVYQKNSLGRHDGEMCLLELLPLPSQSVSHWNYHESSNLHYLRNRKVYRDYVAPDRVKHLQKQIMKYQPRAVVFYSRDKWYTEKWEDIAGVTFTDVQVGNQSVSKGSNNTTKFIIANHPTSWGMRNTYFDQIGQLIKV